MADFKAATRPSLDVETTGSGTVIHAGGTWSIRTVSELESLVAEAAQSPTGAVTLDVSGIDRMDTAGAWLFTKLEAELRKTDPNLSVIGAGENVRRLSAAVSRIDDVQVPQTRRQLSLFQLLVALGQSTANAGRDFQQALGILGGVVRGLFRGLGKPSRFRFTSIVFHLDRSGLQAVPIIGLISFLIGGIVAQQGVFQLSFFGAEDLVVDLVGILVLRELGVLLTAIMLAGRSGSAYTAEIGSMKMREELDAMKVIGLDPIEVLVMPRIVALVIALPLLTVISDGFGLMGGAFVSFIYGDMEFERFILLLRDAVDMSTLMVGIIKAPFMGLIIGLIAANEGFNVQGSAESLGRQTTSSVVKAIFMVIVADGIFAIFFAAIDY